MKKASGVLLTLGLIAGMTTAATAIETSGTLPGGSTLTVDVAVDPNIDGTVEPGAALTVSGQATVDLAPAQKNTDVVFVLDVSGSTGNPAGFDCDGDGVNDSILACEKQAVRQLVAGFEDPRSPVLGVGVAAFPAVPQGSAEADTVVIELTDLDSAPAGFLDVLDDLSSSGGTDFGLGLAGATSVLEQRTDASTEQIIVLLTDGAGTGNTPVEDPGATIQAFAIAGANCADPNLTAVLQPDRDSCQVVGDLAELPTVINDVIGSSIDDITVTVDGTPVDGVSVDGSPVAEALPIGGPAMVSFEVALPEGLAPGERTICAQVTGSEAGTVAEVPVEDCVTITAAAPGTVIIDCGALDVECTASAVDEGNSTLQFSAPASFDEPVTIVPDAGEPGECAGADCRTGYDVLFPSVDGSGPVASITVITESFVSIRDRLRAAVFIDGERIRAECSVGVIGRFRERRGIEEPIPCKSIRYLRTGQLQYLVKFNADPQFRFR